MYISYVQYFKIEFNVILITIKDSSWHKVTWNHMTPVSTYKVSRHQMTPDIL